MYRVPAGVSYLQRPSTKKALQAATTMDGKSGLARGGGARRGLGASNAWIVCRSPTLRRCLGKDGVGPGSVLGGGEERS